MPKLFFILILTTFYVFQSPLSIHAATDPVSATVSATTTIPSTSPTSSDSLAPGAVILISPHDGATTNQSRPELVWKTTFDSNSNNVSYTVFVNGVATYLGISNTGNSQQNNYISHIGDGNIYLTPTIDLNEGTYDWYVRANDGSNNSSFSTTWRFTRPNTPLTVINIDDVYLSPSISEDSFDLPGYKRSSIFATRLCDGLNNHNSAMGLYSVSLPTSSSSLATL
jgi:hypothetical protein